LTFSSPELNPDLGYIPGSGCFFGISSEYMHYFAEKRTMPGGTALQFD
jgi:hypothetical protein